MKDKEKTSAPPALKVAATDIVVFPDGFEKFKDGVRSAIQAICKNSVAAMASGYELGKQIVEYSETKAVKALVDGENKRNRDTHRGGAPLKYHCYVAGLLEAEKVIAKHWAEKCARAFLKDRESDFAMGKKLAMFQAKGGFSSLGEENPLQQECDEQFLQKCLPNPEGLFPPEPHQPGADDFDAQKESEHIAARLRTFFFDREGHARLRTKSQTNHMMNVVNMQLEVMGIDWEFIPKGGE